jgi:zinc transporter
VADGVQQSPLLGAFDLVTGREFGWDEVRSGAASGEAMWIALDRKHPEAAAWLGSRTGLDPLVQDELLAETTRPRVMFHGDGAQLTIRGVNLNPGAVPEDMISVRIWADSMRLISLQGPRLMAVDALIGQIRSGEGPRSVGQLIVAIVVGLTERMAPVIEHINETLDSCEDKVLDPHQQIDRQELIALRQRVIALHRYLSPQVGAMKLLHDREFTPIDAEQDRLLKEAINVLTRYVEDLEAARSRSAVIQDELSNQLAEQANQRVYIVTVIAAIFLPLTLISGVLGMNVGGLPGQEHPHGFLITCVMMTLLGLLALWLVRRSKWL